ncbi:MAG TPA: hypothetical protein VI282_13965 [Verrucomicrobiae bacterium]|jgi:hypothetical protein
MKPTHTITHRTNHRPSSPLIEYDYQAPINTARGTVKQTSARHGLGFWKLSTGFFSNEARMDYATELFWFCIISALAAWPIISMLIAVVRYWRNY